MMTPRGRRLGYWREHWANLPFSFVWVSWAPGLFVLLPGMSDPLVIPYLLITAIAVGLGITVLATASTRHRASFWSGAWWGANSASAVWIGTALLVGTACSYAVGYAMREASLAHRALPFAGLLFCVTPAATLVCVLMARSFSNREVRRTVRAGLAPTYWISPDFNSWWDGAQWVSVEAAAPEAALRSPDRNWWWTGRQWLALPPRPRP
jgi:hypothetical protein